MILSLTGLRLYGCQLSCEKDHHLKLCNLYLEDDHRQVGGLDPTSSSHLFCRNKLQRLKLFTTEGVRRFLSPQNGSYVLEMAI